jgi:hypothetical protein
MATWLGKYERPLNDNDLSRCTEELNRANAIVNPDPRHPCAYGPWKDAFAKIGADAELIVLTALKVQRPNWPKKHIRRKVFAFALLETDPMYHGSGYTKRHLLKRLGQVPLSNENITQLDKLFRRTVLQGAGTEEFRAYCKLAAKLRPPGLEAWLRKLIGLSDLGTLDLKNLRRTPTETNLTQSGYALMLASDLRSLNGVRALTEKIKDVLNTTAMDWDSTDQKIARNAVYMLRAIEKRRISQPELELPMY